MPEENPASYLTLEPGVEVRSSDGERVGTVEHVLADPQADIFDGIVIDTGHGHDGFRFVDAPEVAEIYEQHVVLGIAAADVLTLPRPRANPAAMAHHGVEDTESRLQHKLHRAWEMISGRG